MHSCVSICPKLSTGRFELCSPPSHIMRKAFLLASPGNYLCMYVCYYAQGIASGLAWQLFVYCMYGCRFYICVIPGLYMASPGDYLCMHACMYGSMYESGLAWVFMYVMHVLYIWVVPGMYTVQCAAFFKHYALCLPSVWYIDCIYIYMHIFPHHAPQDTSNIQARTQYTQTSLHESSFIHEKPM